MNGMYYAGSDKNDHYLHHSFLTMRDTGLIRVNKSELAIKDEFAVTKDRSKWRKLDMPLRIDPQRIDPQHQQSVRALRFPP
jgi:hypothetical protein